MSQKFHVMGRSDVTIQELQAMIREFNAGRGPEPELEGGAGERVALMHYAETQGNAEMQAEVGAFIGRQGWHNSVVSRAGHKPTVPSANRN